MSWVCAYGSPILFLFPMDCVVDRVVERGGEEASLCLFSGVRDVFELDLIHFLTESNSFFNGDGWCCRT